jgi:hypothetical protein
VGRAQMALSSSMAFIEHSPTGTWRGTPFVRGRRYLVLQEAPSYSGHLVIGEVLEYFGAYHGIHDSVSVYAFKTDHGQERTWILHDEEPFETSSRVFSAVADSG